MIVLLVKGSQGEEVAKLRTSLASTLGEEAKSFPGLATGDVFDDLTASAARRWQAGIGVIADSIIGPYCQSLLGLASLPELDVAVDANTVRPLFPATKPSSIVRYLPYVLGALRAAGLTDQPMVYAALGTIRAETEGFVPISEFPSHFNTNPGQPPFSAYDARKDLGNLVPGDGASYRGRGFVQLTGRSNYATYSRQIGLDILQDPDLANAPEVAAVLLALFLFNCADRMRKALAAKNYAAARKLVNGGSHGLDAFKGVVAAAPARPTPLATGAARAAGKGKAAAAPPSSRPRLTVTKDPLDLRDREYLPPPVSLPDHFPTNSEISQFLPAYTKAGLILNQGEEGACTGFGLACVVNYLRWRRDKHPAKMESVSPRMLYNFARRYDEYAGEDYDGSSCRGALRGWYHHGVCLESDWHYRANNMEPPRFGYAKRASDHTLGVYYRIALKTVTDLQAAIHEVGAIYVSAYTHSGWDDVPSVRKVIGHESVPVIAFDGKPSQSGGHAFALVGFNIEGFIIQNSWGREWGAGGFALLTYADWLANAMDAWVAALGVPGVVLGQLAAGSRTGVARVGADRKEWWDEATAYEHSIVLGNDGRVTRYLTQDELSRTLLFQACALPDQWFRSQASGTKRLVVYAHGGLNSEADAIGRARALGRYFLGNGCYPLFMVWKTGLLESIGDIFADKFGAERSRAGGIRETLIDAADFAIEKTIGRPLARPLWSEMKENAEFASAATRGGDLFVTALQNLTATWNDKLEIHLVGHSAGAIFLGYLVDLLAERGLDERTTSIHLYAPACTVQFANRHYAPHERLMKRLYLDILSDRNERDDNVAAIYRKSLLYMVSNALESDLRTPILGLANVLDPAYVGWDGSSSTGEALINWRQAAALSGLSQRIGIVSDPKVITCRPDITIDAAHGAFDNDVGAVTRTLERITGAKLARPVDDLRGF